VHRSGFYAWLTEPECDRAKEYRRLLELIREAYANSGGAYGSPRIHLDLKELGKRCGERRVARLMRQSGIKAVRRYRRPHYKSGRPVEAIPNRLEQQFTVDAPDRVWATDITYVRTNEGSLYLAVVLDLYSRRVVGWAMKPTLAKELVVDALVMAVWRRRPTEPVIIHSDQGSQYGSDEWRRVCRAPGLEPSMSRRGNCYDNAVAESFFSSLKKLQVRRRKYASRDEARADFFDYVEVFYNRSRLHCHLGMVSPCDYVLASTGN
jgi:putative transposase